MPACEICENEVDEVYTCKECGSKFCANCGDPERSLCEDCLAYEEEAYGEEEYEYEPEEESEGWEE